MSSTRTQTPTRSKNTTQQEPQKKKTDGLFIAIIVFIILTIVSFIIAIAILFAFGGRADLKDQSSQLLAAGAFFVLAAPTAIVLMILLFQVLKKKKMGQSVKSLNIATLVFAIALGVFLLIGSAITFITANQVAASEKSGLQAAGVFGLLAFLFLAIAFVMILVRNAKKKDVKEDGSYYGAVKRNYYSSASGSATA